MGGQDARRANRGGVLVGVLEITPPQRRYRPHMMGSEAGLTHPSRRGPSQHLGRQNVRRVVAATAGGDQRLAVAEGPGLQQIAVGQAKFEAFVRQFLRLVPSARQPAVKTEMTQGRDQRSDPAALPAFVHHPPQRLPAARLPVGELGGCADHQDAQLICLATQARDGSVHLGKYGGCGTDRVGVGLTEQIQVHGDIRREPAHSGMKGRPQFGPSAEPAHHEKGRNSLENPCVADPVGPGLILDGLGQQAVRGDDITVPVEEHEGGRYRGEQLTCRTPDRPDVRH